VGIDPLRRRPQVESKLSSRQRLFGSALRPVPAKTRTVVRLPQTLDTMAHGIFRPYACYIATAHGMTAVADHVRPLPSSLAIGAAIL
jgi:hypothetical protein